jgi:hypothetical protein
VPGIINAGRNYTNCLLGCRFGLTEAQRPCGAINREANRLLEYVEPKMLVEHPRASSLSLSQD